MFAYFLEKKEEREDGGDGQCASRASSVKMPASGQAAISPGVCFNIAQLELLLRVHVMMAELQGLGSDGHWEACMAAIGYCQLIWKVNKYITFIWICINTFAHMLSK